MPIPVHADGTVAFLDRRYDLIHHLAGRRVERVAGICGEKAKLVGDREDSLMATLNGPLDPVALPGQELAFIEFYGRELRLLTQEGQLVSLDPPLYSYLHGPRETGLRFRAGLALQFLETALAAFPADAIPAEAGSAPGATAAPAATDGMAARTGVEEVD